MVWHASSGGELLERKVCMGKLGYNEMIERKGEIEKGSLLTVGLDGLPLHKSSKLW